MDYLPQDPIMLLSAINMALRDGLYESLEDLCASFDRDQEEVQAALAAVGYEYDEACRQFR